MICFNCNNDYPGAPAEPFWICPNCTKPQEPKIDTAKSFLEIEKPARTKELVLVARWVESPESGTGLCTAMVGHGLCQLSTGWQCFICNQWTCDHHESKKKSYQGGAICEECGELSRDEQELVFTLQEKLNRA